MGIRERTREKDLPDHSERFEFLSAGERMTAELVKLMQTMQIEAGP